MCAQVSVGDVMEGVRSRIKTLYNVPPGTEVFLCPSGSDAEYIPLLIAKTLNKGRKIVNVVTCDAEVRSGVSIPVSALFSLSLSLSVCLSLSLTHSQVGSGTLDAAGGCHFSDVVPLPDADTEGKKLNKLPLEGLAEDVVTVGERE